jgi:transcriptional regulator with XRE-family HTH domain
MIGLMHRTTAELLEAARKRRALSQEALASTIGVKQQTISRWMKGESAPRATNLAALAAALGLSVPDIEAALAADRQVGRALSPDDELPVRPMLATLPFMSLPADRYEQFVVDLMARLHPTAAVSLLGGQGDDQQGFDVQVAHPDGQTINVQCKRESQFGPQKIAKAVSEGERPSDRRIIALARAATAAARFEIDKHDGWELWDQIDLSRLVRTLPEESAQRLVKTYFPNHVEDFLGLAPSGPWMTADEFYRNTSYTLLDHEQDLVGRADLLSDLRKWTTDSGDSEIGVLIGRGGLGKSKLLHDLAAATETEVDVRFLAIGQTPTPADFDLLPSGRPLLVVLDDAHNVDGIAALAAQLQQHRPGARLLLASRPYGEAELDREIWQLGQTPSRARRWRLTDLTDAEARELVAGLINRTNYDPITKQLAAISFDCPFIAVVAADFLSRGELSASAFASDAALRREIVSRYGNQLVSAGLGQDLADRRAVLRALAAYQPVRLNDPAMAEAMTQLSKIDDWDEVNGRIRELEDLGLVLGRGDSIRVVPDMLGDVLLAEAAYDERSRTATSFISRAHQGASGSALQHLLVNASRMDWQLRDGVATGVDIVGQLWKTLKDELLAADYEEQVSLLRLLARIAYFQPAQALELVRAVLDLDVEDTAPANDGGWRWQATRRDVVHALAPVLKTIGYHLEHLPDALDLLWSLAQDDDRPTNQFPDHPMRVLVEMADLRTGKPFDYLFAIIDAAESWLSEPSKLSPFDVLEPMLAVEGSEHVSSGLTLTFHAYGLAPDSVLVVRSRVINVAVDQAKTADVVAAVHAVKALEAAIRGPHGMFNRKPSETEVDKWAQEFVPTILELGSIGRDKTRDPAVRIAVRRALSWHADHGPSVTKTAASQGLARLHRAFIDDVALCLHDGWGRLGLRATGDYQKAEEARQVEFRRVATELVDGRSATEVLDLLEARLGIERAALDGINSAGRFLWDVFTAAPSVAIALLDAAETDAYPELMAFASNAVGALAEQGNEDAIRFARHLCASDDLALKQNVAHALSWNRGRRQGLLPGELDLLIELAADDDDSVRASVGRAVFMIAQSDKASAVELLSKIEFRGNGKVASEALSALIQQGPLSWADTDAALQRAVLDQLVDCIKIDEYEITSALSDLSRTEPVAVTKMLMARVDHAADFDGFEYEALPHHWDPPLQVKETGLLSQCLVMIRGWLTDNRPSAVRYFRRDDGATLYARVAGGWSDQAFAILEVSSASSEQQTLAVAQILSRVPVAVFLARVDLIVKVLRRAAAMGKEAREDVFRTLLPTNGVVVTSWSGDQPDKDVAERDEARRIASDLPHGSIEQRFFSHLADALDGRIKFRADRPEPDFDRRDW